MSINKILLSGRTTKEIELKTTSNGKNTVSFSLAVDGYAKDSTYFFDCVARGKIAEFLAKYVKKGSKIVVVGELTQRKYQTKDGSNRVVNEINTSQVEFMEAKTKETTGDDYLDVDDKDLPF